MALTTNVADSPVQVVVLAGLAVMVGAADTFKVAVALAWELQTRDDSPRNRFSVTSEDVLSAEKAAREQGLEVVGWYHSHPDHPARPSEYDREHAWPWYSYIIVSVQIGRAHV